MDTAVLCDRGQITIPKQFRTRLGFMPRMVLTFRVAGDHLVVSRPKQGAGNPFEAARGVVATNQRTDDIVCRMRGC